MLREAIHDVPYIADPVEVGQGGFAVVYRATDLQAARPVAVKLLSLNNDDKNFKYFDRERESLARMSTHPNVVTLHRTGITTDGVPYLVMEFAPGGSLADRLRAEGALPWDEAVGWVIPICGALAHAHEQGIRHRDVKPQNILISAHGEPLLSDFGIAGLTAGTETVTQKTKLSLSYASPEQIDGLELDDSTDVYSLGATLYTLIAGAPAFADVGGTGFLNTAKRIIEEQPAALDSSVPADIRNAIAAALAKNPANRPSIDEFGRALRRETSLAAPPFDDELSAVTSEIVQPDRVAPPAMVAPMPAAIVEPDVEHGGGRIATALLSRPRRSLSLAAVALLLVIGLITTAWTGFGGDSSDVEGDESADGLGHSPSEANAAEREGGGDFDGSGEPDGQSEPGSPTTSAPTTTNPDRDDDGALNVNDNCPDIGNADQGNNDGDAQGDACDPDDDNDGVPDESDNCRFDGNSDQANVDADELGDACDDFPDRDADGIIDTEDPCIEEPDDPDADGDGIPDKCDASPRGVTVVAAAVRIDRVAIVDGSGDDQADMFGDLTVNGSKFDLPEISDMNEIRPSNWSSDQVAVEPGSSLVQIRIWIRDEAGFCLFCNDGLVDISPEPSMEALHLVVDTATGAVDRASESWNRVGPLGTLSGSPDGDLSGTITQLGGEDGDHQASIDLTLTLVREPNP